jgi:hypothetical protein
LVVITINVYSGKRTARVPLVLSLIDLFSSLILVTDERPAFSEQLRLFELF